MGVISRDQQGVLVSRKSIPHLNEAVRITRQIKNGDIELPANQPPITTASYFSAKKQTTTSIRVSNLRFRYGTSMGTYSDVTGASNDYKDATIPTTAGTYYVYFKAVYGTSYTFSIEVSAINTHPTQSADTFTEEICEVVVANSVISSFKQIWSSDILQVYNTIDSISGMIETAEDKTYVLDQKAAASYKIIGITTKSVAGTATLALKIDAVTVTITTPAFGTTETTYAATANNTVDVGDTLTMVLTSSSGPEDFSFTIEIARMI